MPARLLASLLALVSILARANAHDTQGNPGCRMPVQKVAASVNRDAGGARVSYGDQVWVVGISISGQDLTMRLGTEAGTTWVASTLMSFQDQSRLSTAQIFNPHTSPNYHPIHGYVFSAVYGDGAIVYGPMATEEVTIGGLVLPDLPIGCSNVAYLSGGEVTAISTSGMLGLAFSVQKMVTPGPQPTFMEYLQPSLPAPIFTTSFSATGGFLDFGFVDDIAYTGDLIKIPVDNTTRNANGTWMVPGVQFGSNGRLFNNHTPVDMVFSVEQNFVTLPPSAFWAYLGQVQGANYSHGNFFATYPCDTPLPDLELTFTKAASGPVTVSIPGEKLKLPGANSTCKLVVSPRPWPSGDVFVLGEPFIVDRYLVWNYSEPSISFADATGNGTTIDSPLSSTTPRSSSLSTAARAGIGAAVAVVGLILIAAGFVAFFKRRSRSKAAWADTALEGKLELENSTVEARELRGGSLCEVPGHSKPFELTAEKTYELYGDHSVAELSAGYDPDDK